MQFHVTRSIAMGFGLIAMTQLGMAADALTPVDTYDEFAVSVSLGHLNGVAHELVYNPDGSKVSELVWDMDHALVVNGGLSWQAADRLQLYGNVSAGLAAENYMDDYDWLGDPRPIDANMHSWHDDTDLDHYYSLDLGLGFSMYETGANSFTLLGGFKYTSVKWTAFGGCYNYDGNEGCFDDGEKAISYRLTLPAAYAGLGYVGEFDQWTLSLEGRAGMTVSVEGDDDHWMRDLNFVDDLDSDLYLALNGKAAYALTESADLFGSVAYDKFYRMKGETTITDMVTGESESAGYDSGGADLYTLNIALGLDYRF